MYVYTGSGSGLLQIGHCTVSVYTGPGLLNLWHYRSSSYYVSTSMCIPALAYSSFDIIDHHTCIYMYVYTEPWLSLLQLWYTYHWSKFDFHNMYLIHMHAVSSKHHYSSFLSLYITIGRINRSIRHTLYGCHNPGNNLVTTFLPSLHSSNSSSLIPVSPSCRSILCVTFDLPLEKSEGVW